MKRLLTLPALAVALVLLLAAGALAARDTGPGERTLTAHFPRTVSIYEGSEVRILGVRVGSVDDVTPEGASVRVDMTYDAAYKVPADAKAVIVTPTLVSDRFVQLTPVYTSGATMPDGGDIALPETAVPVELDRIYSALSDLTRTLGPNGVNADGTLNHLLEATANGLDGQGKRANQTIRDLADAAETFDNSGGDLFATVSNLAQFTQTLAANDRLVRAFFADLADVSAQLSDERVELQRTLASVADAVGTVKGFVRTNRQALVTDVEKLTRVVSNINSEKKSIDTALDVAPVAIGNLSLAYNVKSGTIGSRIGISGNVFDADGFLCAVVQQSDIPSISKDLACQVFEALLEPVENQLPTIPPPSGRPSTPADPSATTSPRSRTAPGDKRSTNAAGAAVQRELGGSEPASLTTLLGGQP